MKNITTFTSALLLICSSFTAMAQETSANTIKFGIKGGVNFNNIMAANTTENNVLVGFHLGLFTKLPITDMFAIQPELLFTTKGSEISYQNSFVNGTAKYELNYLEIPIMLVFNLTNQFNFHFGPYASYLLNANVKIAQDINFNLDSNIESGDLNKFDTGIAAGLGFDGEKVGFGVRYNFGLITIGNEKTYFGTNYIFPDGKNSNINLYVTFSIL